MENLETLSIYLDVCCLNRPFDDQSQPRIRLESEAILLILGRLALGEWSWIGSEAILREVDRTPDSERRHQVSTLVGAMGTIIEVNEAALARAGQLTPLGFKALDALHVACAEIGSADVFLTTDDRLVRAAKRAGDQIRTRVDNPLSWLTGAIGR